MPLANLPGLNLSDSHIYDYIIVGQGLAGTVLAHTLEEAGYTFLIIDNAPATSSSTICAGVYNPITGKRLVKTWLADDIFPFLEDFYQKMESKLQQKLLYKSTIEVPIFSHDRWEEAQKRLSDKEYDHWMKMDARPDSGFPYLGEWVGTMTFLHSGYVDVKKMVVSSREKWRAEGKIVTASFDHSSLEIVENKVKVNSYFAKRIVFSEGFRAISNPYFNWIPFARVKGEILEIEANGPDEAKILKSKGVFLLPLANKKYKTGATYVWNDVTETPSEEGKTELMGKFNSAFSFQPQIVGHKAGVRPAVQDRRPVIGNHPVYPNVSIFNGMGTKGVSLAPYFAAQAVGYWQGNTPLHPEVDIIRFQKQYDLSEKSVL